MVSPNENKTPETMSDVRYEVDRLDRELIALLVKRQALMAAAAHIKKDRQDVLDRERIEDVITKVKAESERKGLSVAIAEPVWRVLMDRCIAYEFDVFDRLKKAGSEKH